MQIDEKLLTKWNAMRSAEDTSLIAERANVSSQAIRNAFNEGKCSTKIFDVMATYYEEKGEKIKPFLSWTNQRK